MLNSSLEIKQFKVREIVEDYRSGRLVVPEFQREYVWKRSRAPHLLDSLYRRYPVSVLLLWSSDLETRSRRRDPKPSRGAIAWIIDGQQRVITLSKMLSGDEGIDVVFNPEEDVFRLANAATRKDSNWYRVSELFDDTTYRQIRRGLPEGPKGERREAAFEKLRRTLDYEVPAVKMVDYTFDQAVEAFKRINTLGVKLKKEDIASAEVAAKHSGFVADRVAPFVAKIRSEGFARLNVMHLFRACAFVALPDGRTRTPLHTLSRSEVDAAWARTERATREALSIMRSEFGLVNMDLIWSGALLVPLIALCASIPVRDRDPSAMAGWLAMAALLHRYSSGTEAALDQDLRACRADDPIGRLLGNIRSDEGGFFAVANDFKRTLNDRGALFGAYLACRQRGLRDLFSGSGIVLQKNVDRHHILPRAQFPEKRRSEADVVANVAFITGEVNRAVGASAPDVYLGKLDSRVLDSQCIPADRDLWHIDRAEEFFAARRALLADAFNDYLKKVLPGRRIRSV